MLMRAVRFILPTFLANWEEFLKEFEFAVPVSLISFEVSSLNPILPHPLAEFEHYSARGPPRFY